ncbi:hypothetical protein L1987_14596 [Smallanthus sonchifolius]|uniref:Uncharacterized protein n=1 Tax=Smallanthus sonchifolius TaxID=185202 RepID=A0ACB9J6Q5_9ASTR|nr:hypothetical protein L1987_14596 [Smallanthus sonchifolius]
MFQVAVTRDSISFQDVKRNQGFNGGNRANAFESVGRLFQEFESKRMSILAGDKLVDSENSIAIGSNWVSSMVEFVWKRRNALRARSLILPVESFRASVYPLVYAVKSVASGSTEAFKKLSRSSKKTSTSTLDSSMA